MFDDNGSIVMFGTKKALRRGPTDCEVSIGCLKGHWNNKPELNPNEDMVITLYRSAKSTGGNTLTEEEKTDPFLMECFAAMTEVDEIVDRGQKQIEAAMIGNAIRTALRT